MPLPASRFAQTNNVFEIIAGSKTPANGDA